MAAPLIKICGISTPDALDAALAARAERIVRLADGRIVGDTLA